MEGDCTQRCFYKANAGGKSKEMWLEAPSLQGLGSPGVCTPQGLFPSGKQKISHFKEVCRSSVLTCRPVA